MDFLRNLSRSSVLVAALGLATWSTGCAEQPEATPRSGGEAGSATRPGVSAGDEDATRTEDSTAQENEPLAAPGPAPETDPKPAQEEDNTPIPGRD